MADNLKYNEPGSGPLVATDDVGSVQFQKMKLDVGGDGVSIPVMGSVPVYLVSGAATITATNLDIRDLSAGQDSVDTELPAAAALADSQANPTTPSVGAMAMGFDGTNWQRLRADSISKQLQVIVSGAVQGFAPHNAVSNSYPMIIGGYSETPEDTAPGNQVDAEADVTRLAVDRDGALYTHPHPPRIWHTAAAYSTIQNDTSVKATPGSNLSLYVTDVVIICSGAVTVTLEEAGSVLKFQYFGGGMGDGISKSFVTPMKLTANTALTVSTSAAVGVFLSVCGYTSP